MTTVTTSLTDFLLARIAEDEDVARAASVGPWYSTEGTRRGTYGVLVEDSLGDWLGNIAKDTSEVDAEHIARHDPARVLAECEAKRRIVEALVDAEDAVAGYDNDDPNNPPSYWQEWGNLHALRLSVGLLALPYADHVDYRQEWKP